MPQTPSYLKSLKKESVVQSVINVLTDAIRSKELKPGDRIPPEPELASSLGIARSSVREAIKILTYLGVLESKRSEGTFVCSGFKESMIDPMVYGILLNQDSTENLIELRAMIESGSMRLAMRKATREELSGLEQILQEMHKALLDKENPVESFFQADNRFHTAIQKMGKNPLAEKMYQVIGTLTYAMRLETVKAMLGANRGEELLAAHERLYDILKNKDVGHLDSDVLATYFTDAIEEGSPDVE